MTVSDGYGDDAMVELERLAGQEISRRGLYNHPDRDDLQQEALIAAWRASERPHKTSPGYLRQAAGWRIDTLLNPSKGQLGSEAAGGVARPRTTAISPLPEDDVETSLLDVLAGAKLVDFVDRAYMRGVLVEAISELPPRQRAYVVRRFWGGERPTDLHREFPHRTWEQARSQLQPRLRELLSA